MKNRIKGILNALALEVHKVAQDVRIQLPVQYSPDNRLYVGDSVFVEMRPDAVGNECFWINVQDLEGVISTEGIRSPYMMKVAVRVVEGEVMIRMQKARLASIEYEVAVRKLGASSSKPTAPSPPWSPVKSPPPNSASSIASSPSAPLLNGSWPSAGTSAASSCSAPVLCGEWRHSHGMIFCGTLRIARCDFDTNPHPDFCARVFDDICRTMNAAQNTKVSDAAGTKAL